MGCTVFYFT